MGENYLQYMTDLKAADLRALMEAYGEDVWNYAYFLTNRIDQADDIAQEVFIKAYRSFHSFRGEASEKTWLLKITRNTAYSYRKLAFFRKVTLMDSLLFQNASSLTPASPSAEEEYIEREKTDAIWNVVLELPRKFRDPFVLSMHFQMSMEEIAAMLELPIGTVKSRIYRAKKRLSEKLKGGADCE